MPAEIDKLEIAIETKTQDVSDKLDGLINKLNELSGALGGLKSNDLTRVYSQLRSLSKIDFSGTSKSAKSGSIFGGISSALGGAGKAAISAEKSLKGGIGSIYGKFGELGSTALSTGKSLYSYSKSAISAARSSSSLINVATKLYAKFFVLRRLFGFFKDAFTSSMDYVESYHYFEVAYDKIGEESKNQFAQYGYESAEAYADSFSKRALELNEKMSGFRINESGYAQSTGEKSLGLDSDMLLQYQAQFAQMADSIGMTGEAASATSKALTMLAADWSSLRNIDLETSYQKMTSALAGQSRAVRTLGIDITQAALAETAANIGMTTSISKMGQVEKAELRMITMLQQSRVAWGDMAKTLNTPANQLRMLAQNFKALARTIGNLFLPVIARVLPYINGLVIALQRLFQWIANLLGIDVGKMVESAGGLDDALGDFGEDFSDPMEGLEDATDDAKDALEDAEEEAKELQKTILGFDELNVLNPPEKEEEQSEEPGGSGADLGLSDSPFSEQDLLDNALLSLLDEYEKAWQEAFEKMASAAHDFANKLAEIGKRIWDFIKSKDYEGLGAYLAEGVNWILQKLYDLLDPERFKDLVYPVIDAFTETFNSLVDHIDWGLLGSVIGRGINDLGYALLRAIQGIDWAGLGAALAKAINGLFGEIDWPMIGQLLAAKIMSLWDFLKGFIEALDTKELGKSVADLLNNAISGIDFEEIGHVLAEIINKAFDFLDAFIDEFDWGMLRDSLAAGINKFINDVNWSKIGTTLGKLFNKTIQTLTGVIEQIKWDNLARRLSNGLVQLIATVEWERNAEAIAGAFNSVLAGINTALDMFPFEWTGNKIGAAIMKFLEDVRWDDLGHALSMRFKGMLLFFKGIIETDGIFKEIGASFASLLNGALSVETLSTAGEVLAKAFNGLFETIEGFINGTDKNDGFDWSKLSEELSTGVNNFIATADFEAAGKSLNSFLHKILTALVDAAKETHWEILGQNIVKSIKKLDWPVLLGQAVDLIKETLGGLLSGMLSEALGGFGEDFADGFITGIENVIAISEGAVIAISTALGALADVLDKFDPELVRKLGEALGFFFGIRILAGWGDALLGAVTGLLGMKKVVEGGTLATGTGVLTTALMKLVTKTIPAGIKTIYDNLKLLISTYITDGVNTLAEGLKALVTDTIPTGLDALSSSLEAIGALGNALGLAGLITGVVELGDQLHVAAEKARGLDGEITPIGTSIDQVTQYMDQADIAVRSLTEEERDSIRMLVESMEHAGLSSEEMAVKVGAAFAACGYTADEMEALWTSASDGANLSQEQIAFWQEVVAHMPETVEQAYADIDLKNEALSISTEQMSDAFERSVGQLQLTSAQMDGVRGAIDGMVGQTYSARDAYDILKEKMEALGIPADSINKYFGELFPDAVTRGTGVSLEKINELIKSVTEGADESAQKVSGASQEISDSTSQTADSMKENFNDAKDTIKDVSTEVDELGNKSSGTKGKMDPMLDAIASLASNMTWSDSIKLALISACVKTLGDNSDDAKDQLYDLSDEIGNYSSNDELITHTDNIATSLENAGVKADEFWDVLKTTAEEMGVTIPTEFSKTMESIANLDKDAEAASKKVGNAISDGMKEGIADKSNGVSDSTKKMADESVIGAFKDELDIHSPSGVFDDFGKNIDESLGSAITNYMSEPKQAIRMLGSDLKSDFDDIAREIPDVFSNVASDIARNFEYVQQEIRYAVGDLYWLGRDLASSFGDGFSSQHITLPHIEWSWDRITYGNGGWVEIPNFFLNWYAKGGFPSIGELFVANEKGPEMVGQMGKKNVVANNMQIIEGIKQGFMEAMFEVAVASNDGDETPYQMNINLIMPDGEVLARQVEKGNMRRQDRFAYSF